MMFGSFIPAALALLLVGDARAEDEKTAPDQDSAAAAQPAEDSAGKQRKAARASKKRVAAPNQAAAHRAPVAASPARRAAPAHTAARRPPGHAAAAYHAPAADHHARALSAHRVAAARHYSAAHAAWAARYHGRPGWFGPWRPGYRPAWYHGVFVYGPGPVVVSGPGGEPGRAAAPKREINHAGKLSLGIRGGSYISGYDGGASYGDAGLGLAARYRIVEPLGLEVQWMYHDQSWEKGTERIQQPISASAELFAFPWSRVNPYVVAGVSATARNVSDDFSYGQEETDKMLWGPHVGLGLEVNLTKQVSVNLDGRYLSYVNAEEDSFSAPNAFQGNLGVNFYF